jgi:hypothetical protein
MPRAGQRRRKLPAFVPRPTVIPQDPPAKPATKEKHK